MKRNNLYKKSWASCHVFVIPHLGRERQADPWGSLSSQPSQTSKFQVSMSDPHRI